MKRTADRLRFHVDLDKILDVALRGVRRASVFMGLGINAALNPNVKEYQLTKITKLQLMPEAKDGEIVSQFKNEFRTWVEGNGLRELIETFAIFLDRIHDACIVFRASRDKVDIAPLREKHHLFHREGFPKKLNILRTSFSVGPKYPDYLLSLNRARNCLTHRRGIVANADINVPEALRVAWLGMDIFVETPSGERHSLMDIPPEGLLVREGGTACLQFVERERLFDLESIVRLSTRDLGGDLLVLYERGTNDDRDTIEYAKACGVAVQVVDKKEESNEAPAAPPESNAPGRDGF